MKQKIMILSEISQTEKDKHSITHMWNLIFFKNANKLIYKIGTDLQILRTNLGSTKGEMWWGGINQEFSMKTHTLTTMYMIDNQQRPTVQHQGFCMSHSSYHLDESTHHPRTTNIRKESKKE